MLFVFIRLAFWGIAFVIGFCLIRKSRVKNRKRWSMIALIAAVAMVTIIALIPFENVFVTFSSPESAYHYNHSGKAELVISGEKPDFVVSDKGDT